MTRISGRQATIKFDGVDITAEPGTLSDSVNFGELAFTHEPNELAGLPDAVFTGPPNIIELLEVGKIVELEMAGTIFSFVVTGISGGTASMRMVNNEAQ